MWNGPTPSPLFILSYKVVQISESFLKLQLSTVSYVHTMCDNGREIRVFPASTQQWADFGHVVQIPLVSIMPLICE